MMLHRSDCFLIGTPAGGFGAMRGCNYLRACKQSHRLQAAISGVADCRRVPAVSKSWGYSVSKESLHNSSVFIANWLTVLPSHLTVSGKVEVIVANIADTPWRLWEASLVSRIVAQLPSDLFTVRGPFSWGVDRGMADVMPSADVVLISARDADVCRMKASLLHQGAAIFYDDHRGQDMDYRVARSGDGYIHQSTRAFSWAYNGIGVQNTFIASTFDDSIKARFPSLLGVQMSEFEKSLGGPQCSTLRAHLTDPEKFAWYNAFSAST